MTRDEAEKRTILKVLVGSHIHGLNVESSDRDYEAVVIEPMVEAVGFKMPFEELIIETPDEDVKYVSLRKWCRLALKGNPNFLLLLFAPREKIITSNSLGETLIEMRDLFLSKHSVTSHLGYLRNQRHRLTKGNSNNGRGKPRLDMLEKFGYDVKFAMHLLRVGLQGVEMATSGRITLPMRSVDREWLLAVRNGQFSLEWVLEQAAILEADMEAALAGCKLPDEPDVETVEKWMLRRYRFMWHADRPVEDWQAEQTLMENAAKEQYGLGSQ